MADNSQQYPFTLRNGHYEIFEKVGGGGMGIVYRGTDILMRAVAIKEFSPSEPEKLEPPLLAELKAAFHREAKLLAKLEHPSLPKVYDYFTENDKLYLVMEYIDGDNLKTKGAQLKKTEGEFSIKKVRQWAKELLEVLVYLHDRDLPIFHRDIKPDNLKIRGGRICLLDFGLARATVSEMSVEATRTIFGFTLRYAPIEQIRGEKTTPQTDLYALAATIYFLLTTEEPVDSFTRDKDKREYGSDPLRSIKELRPEVDEEFGAIIMEALAVEAKDRPVSARAMLERLEGRSNAPQGSRALEPIDPDLTILQIPSTPPPATPLPPPFSPPPPTPTPSPSPYAPIPGPLSAKTSQSPRNWLVFVLIGGIFLFLLVVTSVFIFIRRSVEIDEDNQNQSSGDNQNQPRSSSKKLVAERELYDRPFSRARVIDTLPSGTSFEVVGTHVEGTDKVRFFWSHIRVLGSQKDGWVRLRCMENEEAKPNCE